ncbi:MAG TPA: hypothetical protein VL337_04745 [Acidimicrobiales bacterium]|jgi:hypothetical protein|nr:hypothetical protein [Acidimicrobiales bacterium]
MHLPRPTRHRWLPLAAALPLAAIFALPQAATSSPELARFSLFPVAKFLPCMAAPGQTPTATATVVKGDPNDTLVLSTSGFKPGLKFDLFTIQRSSQQADGSPATVPGVGMAWYQSDVDANSSVALKTVLVDQIFGFDPDVALAPTNTFHMGFWFNNPADAAACGFTGTTPFNGEHNAGPLAFVTRPSAATNLGPLCLNPDTSTSPARCNP